MEIDMDDICVCQRPLASVMCRNCGYRLSHCRKMKTCPEHPNVYFIQDLTECPECHNSKDYLYEYGSSKNSSSFGSQSNTIKS